MIKLARSVMSVLSKWFSARLRCCDPFRVGNGIRRYSGGCVRCGGLSPRLLSLTPPGVIRLRTVISYGVSRLFSVTPCGVILLFHVIAWSIPSQAIAQPVEQKAGDLIQAQRWLHNSDPLEGMPLLIETSAPIANLLMRAEEGIERRDWKLAIDSLQRVIDDRTGTLVPREDGANEGGLLFESARRWALRRLATMPAEGMLAYRVLYDGKAKGLFERARVASDAAAMQAVADRFLLTRYGDDAADWAASRAIDEGRFGEAVSRLNDILTYVPDNDIPPDRIFAKLYAAYMFMGFPQDATHALESYRQRIIQLANAEDHSSKFVKALGENWAEQAQRRVAEAEEAGESLPRRMGPQLNPSLTGPVPWGYELTGTSADLWRRIVDIHPGDPAPIPRMELVGNGQQLFVRTPGGCVALDMEDLTLVWQAAGVLVPRVSQVEGPRRGLTPATASRPSGPYIEDSANQIALAQGLVFTIERQGTSEFLDRDEVQAGGVLFVRPGPRTLRMVSGTRLTAYDSQTGDIRWQRGRTDDGNDVLASVRFLSPPIAVHDQLWVPYLQESDLHVAALRPADGALLKHALIGSVREPAQDRGQQVPQREPVTPLTLEDGIVYVPTGVGAVSAIDVAGMQVRWTFVYDAQSGGRRRADTPARWIASPPIVESGVVVLVATDYEKVLGIDAATGAHRWTASVEGCSYPIAAHRGTVWLGGQRIVSLSLADGRELWSSKLSDTPTGKAALCGDQIHVPVSTGLITLDAQTGNHLAAQELPTSQAPLGNIACVGSSLYSLEPSSVRKFPDLDRMHEAAILQLEANPGDIGAVIRLAWSELLRGQPRAAYEAVRSVSDEQSIGLRVRMSLARVKIESLLAVAQQAESSQESLRLLQSASSADLTPALRLRFATAIADQLAALGRSEEAYRALMTLALSADAGELSQAKDGVRVAARLGLRSKIETLRNLLDAATSKKLDAESRNRVSELAAAGDTDVGRVPELFALSQVYGGSDVAQTALLGLAEAQLKSREYEQAEQNLLQCARESADPTLTMGALTRLATMHLESEPLSASLSAQSVELLESHLESNRHVLPQELRGRGAAPSVAEAEELIAKLRTSPIDERQALGLAGMYAEPGVERAGMSLSGRLAWTYEPPTESEPVRIVLFEKRLPRAMADRVMILGRDGFLECISLESKERLWRTKLQMPGRFDESDEAGTRSQSITRYGVIDGQTVILNGPDGIFAVGALTGRLLWARPFDRAVMDLAGSAARDRIMAAVDGWVVAAPRDGYLTMMRVADGSTVWERDLRGESLARVWMEGDAVVFADADMKRAHILARSDGRLISRILLRQPDPEHERVTLVLSDGMLYGPDRLAGSESVAAFDVSNGERRWRVEVGKPIVSLFEPKSGYLGVGLLGGDVKILDARSGEVVLERSDPSVRAVTAGVMWAGTLILRSTALRGPKQSLELAAFDIATGTEEWRRKDVAALSSGDDRLEVIGGVIPAIIEKSKVETVGKQGGGTRLAATATLIDVRTGADAGTPTELVGSAQGVSLNGDMVLWPGILTIGSMKGIQAMRVELTALPERGF